MTKIRSRVLQGQGNVVELPVQAFAPDDGSDVAGTVARRIHDEVRNTAVWLLKTLPRDMAREATEGYAARLQAIAVSTLRKEGLKPPAGVLQWHELPSLRHFPFSDAEWTELAAAHGVQPIFFDQELGRLGTAGDIQQMPGVNAAEFRSAIIWVRSAAADLHRMANEVRRRVRAYAETLLPCMSPATGRAAVEFVARKLQGEIAAALQLAGAALPFGVEAWAQWPPLRDFPFTDNEWNRLIEGNADGK